MTDFPSPGGLGSPTAIPRIMTQGAGLSKGRPGFAYLTALFSPASLAPRSLLSATMGMTFRRSGDDLDLRDMNELDSCA